MCVGGVDKGLLSFMLPSLSPPPHLPPMPLSLKRSFWFQRRLIMQSPRRIDLTNHRVSATCYVSKSLNAATKFSKVRKAVYQALISLTADNKFILVLESMNISDPPRDKQYCLGCSLCHCQRTPNTVTVTYDALVWLRGQ